MDNQPRDLPHLIEFLDYAEKNGYVMPGTARNRKRVVNNIFSTVQNVDTTDVTTLDLNALFDRFKILTASKIPVSNLPAYKSHLTSAIREFRTYLTDPATYRPAPKGKGKLQSRKTRAPTVEKRPHTIAPPTEALSPLPAQIADDEASLRTKQTKFSPSLHIDIQIHISPQASESQIDKVFESMAKHFRNLSDITTAT